MQSDFIQRLAQAEREIRALKTAQHIPSLIRGFSKTFTVSFEGGPDPYQNGIYHYRVTYGDGPQPILSEFYYEGLVWAHTPSGNTQDIYCYAQVIAECTIMSTRPITSVEKMSS